MKKSIRLSVLSLVCLSLIVISNQVKLFSQADTAVSFPQKNRWWEHDNIFQLPRSSFVGASTATDDCGDLPGVPISPAWWGISWIAQIDNSLEIIYQNWCGTLVQVTNDPASDIDPTFDPLGTRIAFATNRDGNYEIYTVKPDRTELQRITNNFLNDRTPDWSVNNQIVFSSGSSTIDNEIWVMNPDGSAQQQLTNNNLYDVQPVWSPDGLQIYWIQFSADSDNGQLWRMNRDGSGAVPLTGPLLYLSDPRISPDGQQIILEMDYNGDGPVDLVMMNSDGSNLHMLQQSNFDRNNPPQIVYEYWAGTWLPDNSGLIYHTLQYRLSGNKYMFESSQFNFHCIDTNVCAPRTFSASPYNFAPDVVHRDPFPPSSKMSPLPQYTIMPDLNLTWSGKDEGISGLVAIDLQYKTSLFGEWIPFPGFEHESSDLSGKLNLQRNEPGEIFLRMRAIDGARNQEAFPTEEQGEASTTMISGWQAGKLTDNRGVPYSIKPVEIQPSGVVTGFTNAAGEFALPVFTFEPFTLNQRWYIKSSTIPHKLYLTPIDNVLGGGGFEANDMGFWGGLSLQEDADNPIVGERTLLFANSCVVLPCTEGNNSKLLMTSKNLVPSEQNLLPFAYQRVTVPLTMTNPTLSFLYRVTASEPITSYFDVTVSHLITESEEISSTPPISNVMVSSLMTETITTTQIFSQSTASDWALHWIDMNQWAGESITVTFALHEQDNVKNMIVYLDEVSLGSWKTPLPQQISPLHIDYGPAVTLTITGENFIDLPVVTLNGSIVSDAVKVNDTTLEVAIPKNFAPGVYYVQVINPEGQDALAPMMFAVGKQTYLPVIAR